ncbi:MAG: NADPH-dependent F420 reductase [Halobacteriaceae archaeon]
MHVALLGGTGDIGEGLALRFGADTDHDVVVGSRDASRAEAAAAAYRSDLASRGVEASVTGAANADAAAGAEVVVAAVPPYHLRDTVAAVSDRLADGAIVVSPAVGMDGDEDGLHYDPPSAGSLTRLAAEAAPDGTSTVGAFHNLAAGRLADLDADLDADTPIVGDDEAARETVASLAGEIDGLRALDAGPIANAPEVESLTPLLINLARYNEGLEDASVRFE